MTRATELVSTFWPSVRGELVFSEQWSVWSDPTRRPLPACVLLLYCRGPLCYRVPYRENKDYLQVRSLTLATRSAHAYIFCMGGAKADTQV